MRQAVLFGLIAIFIGAIGLGYNTLNPPPAKHYKIVYFGAGNCGACNQWKREVLPDWKQTAAGQDTRIVIKETATLAGLTPTAFGSYNDIWRKVTAKTRGVPAFALVDTETNEVQGVYMGSGGWRSLARKVSTSHYRKSRLELADNS
ncbi:MAG: hypothetical protein CME88_06250 [Hirschia sp.]|nr:hypothetical protein [Hirschia sp.]MBB36875.1 hypothetical protein [Hirschia sp.]MBF17961.1 hypothetical protein [Hirschia sp.]